MWCSCLHRTGGPNTHPDGRPRNFWHLREWSEEELSAILSSVPEVEVEWNFINGPYSGPFTIGQLPADDTLALSPALLVHDRQGYGPRMRSFVDVLLTDREARR
jgi:hypothetical protein